MRRSGELVISREADGPLLDYAESTGGAVLSRDRFLDKRRERHWIPERYFTWDVVDGALLIRRQPPRNTQGYDISRKIEQKLIQGSGIDDLNHPAVRRRWACESNPACLTRESSPEVLLVLPKLIGNVPVCPVCMKPVRDLGPRPAEAEIKVQVDGEDVARFTLKQGAATAFGRLTLPDTSALAGMAAAGAFDDVGRTHAQLRMIGRRLAVRPIDGRHHVWVRPWDSKRRRFQRERKLPDADDFTGVGLRDVLQIGEHVDLVRSGRSIAEAAELGEPVEAPSWRVRKTADS